MFKLFDQIYGVAMELLPTQMDSAEARAMLIAIALQESRFEHRRQIGGPAKSFWQFEQGGGVRGVLNHSASRTHIRTVLKEMCYDETPITSYTAIEHNDVLACVYARLLLWTLPDSLPLKGQEDRGWQQYFNAWRPGKPHRETWDIYFRQAWELVDGQADEQIS